MYMVEIWIYCGSPLKFWKDFWYLEKKKVMPRAAPAWEISYLRIFF